MSMQQAVDTARRGYHVAVIGAGARHRVGEAERHASDVSGIIIFRANGRERITFPGGGSIYFYRDADGARGTTLDAAYLTDISLATDGRTLKTLEPCFHDQPHRIGVLI
ncbi:hypothetical protein [Microbacterium aerolatum]|uniref:hypothetical protein n=1 Tax=Microbacterium aerolatum TaxID=153731 RepID=UPI00384F8346